MEDIKRDRLLILLSGIYWVVFAVIVLVTFNETLYLHDWSEVLNVSGFIMGIIVGFLISMFNQFVIWVPIFIFSAIFWV